MSRQRIAGEVRADLDWFVELGVLPGYDDLDPFLDWYETEWLYPLSWGDVESDDRIASIVQRYLERRDVLFAYDPECISDYGASYGRLIDRYVEIADGYLDDIDVEIRGDHWKEENARVAVTAGGVTIEGTMEYATDWADSDGLYELLREVVAVTDADRTFEFVPHDAAYDPTVAFVKPRNIHRVVLYLRDRTKLDPSPVPRRCVLSRARDAVAEFDDCGVFERNPDRGGGADDGGQQAALSEFAAADEYEHVTDFSRPGVSLGELEAALDRYKKKHGIEVPWDDSENGRDDASGGDGGRSFGDRVSDVPDSSAGGGREGPARLVENPVERLEAFVTEYERAWYDLGEQAESAGVEWTVQNLLREFLVECGVAGFESPENSLVERVRIYAAVADPWLDGFDYEIRDGGETVTVSAGDDAVDITTDGKPLAMVNAHIQYEFQRLLDRTTETPRELKYIDGDPATQKIVLFLESGRADHLEALLTRYELRYSTAYGLRRPPKRP